tara:strand:- start:2304 stop:2873 length:570 start_codon:yes stop_codon:yes gene_type:complete
LFAPFFGNFKKPEWYNTRVRPKRRDRSLKWLAYHGNASSLPDGNISKKHQIHFGRKAMDTSLYIVVAANSCWGAAESLQEALGNACLREDTRLSHFNWVVDQGELQELWDSWKDYGEEEWRLGPVDKPVECAIYFLDSEIWEHWRICDMTGSLSAALKDPEVSPQQASKKLGEIQIRALFDNGVLKPRK